MARFGVVAFLAFLIAAPLFAQNPPAAPPRAAPTGPGVVRGKLVDSVSGRALGGGSITVRRAADTSFAGGTLVRDDGSFIVEGLLPGSYTVRARTIGFVQVIRPVAITPEKPLADLGTIRLKQVTAVLDTQRVVAEREQTVVQPDRTVYNTRNMPAASGGTSIDVLRNIPQVEVDASNRVSLRGNANVVIQINGRPTPLKGDQLGAFLAQLPATTLKTVEVAANPSAKDDPEGTAGIINLVLNQEAEVGLSGGLSASTSSTGQASGYGNIGKQQGKFIAFISANAYSDRRVGTGTIWREHLVQTTPRFVETAARNTSRPLSAGGNLRSEYRFTTKNSLTLDAYFGRGRFANSTRNVYTDLGMARDPIAAYDRLTEGRNTNLYHDWDLAFRRIGKPTEPQLTLEVEYLTSNNTNVNDLTAAVIQPGPTIPALSTDRDRVEGKFPYYMGKVDFVKPFGTKAKLDIGGKYQDRRTDYDFVASTFDPTSQTFVVDPVRTRNFEYHEQITGLYGLLSRSFVGKIQTQIGTRLELAATEFHLPLTNQHFAKDYTSVYPSGIFTYNFKPTRFARVSYSRRVTRPNPFMLSPIESRQDSRNVFRGNPDLDAEYTDALDLSFQEAFKWGSITLNPYGRRSNNAVRNIQFVDPSGVSVSTFANVASSSSVGADLNLSYRRGKFMGGAGGAISRYSSDASNITLTSANLSTVAISWNVRGNGTWTFSKKTDAQLFANYRAPTKTEGGSSLAFVNLSVGGRYKVWGEQGNISLRVNDPLKMSRFGYRTANGQVIELSRRYFGSRAVFLTVTRNFGQALRLRAKSESEAPQGGAPPP
jgi:ferric enterobactin receptor